MSSEKLHIVSHNPINRVRSIAYNRDAQKQLIIDKVLAAREYYNQLLKRLHYEIPHLMQMGFKFRLMTIQAKTQTIIAINTHSLLQQLEVNP